jgi:hypothetical protein
MTPNGTRWVVPKEADAPCSRKLADLRALAAPDAVTRASHCLLGIGFDARALLIGFRETPFSFFDDLVTLGVLMALHFDLRLRRFRLPRGQKREPSCIARAAPALQGARSNSPLLAFVGGWLRW